MLKEVMLFDLFQFLPLIAYTPFFIRLYLRQDIEQGCFTTPTISDQSIDLTFCKLQAQILKDRSLAK